MAIWAKSNKKNPYANMFYFQTLNFMSIWIWIYSLLDIFLWTKGADVLCCIPSWLKMFEMRPGPTLLTHFIFFFSSLKPWHYTFVPPIKFYLLILTFLVLINSTVFCPHRSKSWLTYDLHKRHPIYSNIFFEFKEFQNVCYFTHYYFVLIFELKHKYKLNLWKIYACYRNSILKGFF